MIKEIRTRKFYAEPEEGEEANAIITYRKAPWINEQKAGLFYNTTFRHSLRIDLWIWIIYIEWESKENRLNKFVDTLMPTGHCYVGMDLAAGVDRSVFSITEVCNFCRKGYNTYMTDGRGPVKAEDLMPTVCDDCKKARNVQGS